MWLCKITWLSWKLKTVSNKETWNFTSEYFKKTINFRNGYTYESKIVVDPNSTCDFCPRLGKKALLIARLLLSAMNAVWNYAENGGRGLNVSEMEVTCSVLGFAQLVGRSLSSSPPSWMDLLSHPAASHGKLVMPRRTIVLSQVGGGMLGLRLRRSEESAQVQEQKQPVISSSSSSSW